MKTLSTLTGIQNDFINLLVITTVLFIAFTLGAVVVEAFSDLDQLNRAF